MSNDPPGADGMWPRLRDELLGEAAANGSEEAFGAIFGKYGQDLFQLCCAIGGTDDPEDLYRRTLARAKKELGQGIKSLKPWLFGQAWAEAPPESEDEVDAEPARGTGDGWFTNLSRKPRVSLVMHHFGGMAFDAIGEAVDLSHEQVGEYVTEARYEMVKAAPAQTEECRKIQEALESDARPVPEEVEAHLAQCPHCLSAQNDLPEELRRVLPKLATDKLKELLKESLKADDAWASGGQGRAEPQRGRRDKRDERGKRDRRGERDRRGGPGDRAAMRAALAAHRRRRSLAAGGVLALLLFTAVLAATTGRLTPDGDPGHINAEKLSSVPFLKRGAGGVGGVVVSCGSRTERCQRVPTPCRADIRRRVRAAGCKPGGLPCRDGTVEPDCRPPRRPCRDGTVEPDCHPPPVRPRCRNGTIEPNCDPPVRCPDRTIEPHCSIPVVITRCDDGLIEPHCTRPCEAGCPSDRVIPRCPDRTVEPDCHPPGRPPCPDGTVEPDCHPPGRPPCPDGTVEPHCIPVVCTDRDHDCEHQYGLLDRGARSRLPFAI